MALLDNAFYVNFGNGSSTGWFGLTAWSAGATKHCGDIIRQATVSPAATERVFVCIASTSGTGTTGGAEPAWGTTTRGQKFTDNTVTWQECSGIAALNGDLTNTPTWAQYKAVTSTGSLGQVIKSGDGTKILIMTTAGTIGASEPASWATFTNAGATTVDNGATWTTIAAVPSGFANGAAVAARVHVVGANTWAQAGNYIFVGDNSAETSQPNASINTSGGTNANPLKIISFDHNGTYPPTALLAGASIATAAGTGIIITNSAAYWYGITFISGTNTGATSNITIGGGAVSWVFDNCNFNVNNTSGSSGIILASAVGNVTYVEWRNCSVKFGAAGQSIQSSNAQFNWKNSTALMAGSTVPTVFFVPNAAGGAHISVLEGVDFNAVTSGILSTPNAVSNVEGLTVFNNCKINSGVTTSATPGGHAGWRTDLVATDSTTTYQRSERWRYQATETTETSITRVGGATDPAGRTQSRKIVTTANSYWLNPYTMESLAIWNSTTGQNVTVTVEGTINAAAVPKNDDIWIEVLYFGSNLTPLGTLDTTNTKTSILASNGNQTTSSSTWNGGGSGAGWSPFKMVVILSSPQPAVQGYIYVRVKVAKAGTTYYIDPQITLS